MCNITYVCLFVLILLPASKLLAVDVSSDKRRPNIIFIFADDWGYGDLGIHGNRDFKTPHLDRMAKEGIDFQNFTVNHPVCSPSRAAVMTGQFPARNQIHAHFSTLKAHIKNGMPDWLDPQVTILPRLFQEAGYATGHFGKWHLSSRDIPDAPAPTAYGYDEFQCFSLPGPEILESETSSKAVEFIQKHKDKPFFMNVWLHETHLPHYPQPRYMEQFKHLDKQKQVYAAVLAEGDAGVGMILDTLKKLGLDDNTLVIFSSDNGPERTTKPKKHHRGRDGALGGYYSVGTTGGLKGRKRSLYAGGVRVPFIVRWPSVVPSGKVDRTSVITAVDLMPTFLKAAGITMPKGFKADGENVLAAFKGQNFKRQKTIYWEWAGRKQGELWPHLGIREGPWKLLFNNSENKVELYNIDQDWAEQSNLAKQYPEHVKALKEKSLSWKHSLRHEPAAHTLSKLRK